MGKARLWASARLAAFSFVSKMEGRPDCTQSFLELAEFERLAEQVHITAEVLKKDGFTENPFYKCLVAELSPGQKSKEGFAVVGYALYFFTYSTWTGRCLYLEDLYVMPEFRGNGIGKKLIRKVAQVCLELGCCRLQLSVLEWNRPAMDLYSKKGALNMTTSEGWQMMRFQGDALKELAWEEIRN